jgi:hypothetical protein
MSSQSELNSLLQLYKGQYEEPTEITEGYRFDMPNTINIIELYYASKFKTGDRDSQGNKKYFFNIVNPQCGNATKNIDIDRNEIKVRAERKKDRIKAMLYNDRLKWWMKEENIGVLLNKMSVNLPIYGSIVLKKVGDDIHLIPMSKIMMEPSLSNKDNTHDINSVFIIEEHNMSASDIAKMKKKGWDAEVVDRFIDQMRKDSKNTEIIYEMHAETPPEYEPTMSFISERGDLFFKAKEDKAPYKKMDLFTIEGRALGLGIVELLSDLQIRRNEMGNQKADSMRVTSKTLFQTRDGNIDGNMLTDLLNGDIIVADQPITQIDTTERNLGAYAQEEQNIIKDTRDLSSAHEIVTGESLPSRTPFRLGAMQLQQASKIFEFIKENMSIFLQEVFEEWIIPRFEKEIDKDFVFEVYDAKTLRSVFETDVNRRINEATKRIVLETGSFPPKEEIDILKEALMADADKPKFVEILKGYFKDFNKTLFIDITGEQHNTAQEVETMSNMLQLMAQNPQIMQDEQLRSFLLGIAEKTGIDPSILPSSQGSAVQPALNQTAPLGGQVPLAQNPQQQ